MDSDEEDFVFYGTPIEREEDVSSRKKKAVAEASGQLRALPAWKQEVTDEEGRRRFHGAFTGGFSAGYYNTVGSKEGWTPQTFTSSRKNRAEVKQQSLLNFLDDDEKAEMEGRLGTSMQYDTFGFTAAELARKQAEKEQKQRPSAIPGPAPDEVVLPVTESIGLTLLQKMGWRRGRSINSSHTDSLYNAKREARKAFLAFSFADVDAQPLGSGFAEDPAENIVGLPTDDGSQFSKSTPVYMLNPKQDLHGLGYDPYKNAPEFREKKRSRQSNSRETGHQDRVLKDSLFGFKSGRVAPGFGVGALEDLDVEDEDVYASGYDFEETYVEEVEEPSRPKVENLKMLDRKAHDILPGFSAASKSDYQLERFDPPVIPQNFVPLHKFAAPLEYDTKAPNLPPPVVPLPEDNNLRILIEGLATLVARSGKLLEDLSREKNQFNPLFGFLNGGEGHEYYARKLWEERQKRNEQGKQQLDAKNSRQVQKMTAETRGQILGEKPIERSVRTANSPGISADAISLTSNLSDTFTKPASINELLESAKPFQDDPAKQERFEQFLKEKYHGGLRPKDSSGASNMSEAARARERLEFESVAETINKGKQGKGSVPPIELLSSTLATAGLQFTPGAAELAKFGQDDGLAATSMYPKREEFQWRPSPILCKRFDLIDPYMGKPPPAPRSRSKLDSLIYLPDSVKASNQEGHIEKGKEMVDQEIEVDAEPENIERPVDLYKAIFSDDSDEEAETSNQDVTEDSQKKVEAVNTTLNRLIAGDFLESLGKELGLEVPTDIPCPENRTSNPAKKDTVLEDQRAKIINQSGNGTSSTSHAVGEDLSNSVMAVGYNNQNISQEGIFSREGTIDINSRRSGIRGSGTESNRNDVDKNRFVTEARTHIHAKAKGDQCRNKNGSSSEDETDRKRKRPHRSSSPYASSDSSEDYKDRRSRSRKKKSSHEKRSSSSKRHSKHHKHRRRDSRSPSRHSRHGSERDHRETNREKRKYKD
ncbi:G patch domain-containing protein TGH [Capsicum annuum]|uniref:G patch domain-containing protein TGH isoform X1 n=2 Tax=Capsicum annuum TaxID=4072 RepID=UPI001FB0DD3C|nr:G patch domain-containing protein TGH isoform X1 [Capsicum annuum]KAF3650585.1 G patch domain-containing protein TGH [Capsicum annuum]